MRNSKRQWALVGWKVTYNQNEQGDNEQGDNEQGDQPVVRDELRYLREKNKQAILYMYVQILASQHPSGVAKTYGNRTLALKICSFLLMPDAPPCDTLKQWPCHWSL